MTDPVAPVRGRLFQARGAAQYLGITVSRVRALVASGELVAMRKRNGRLAGVYQHDCDAWVAAGRQPATSTLRPAVDDVVAQLPGAGHFA